jgi:hypothetical protein
MASTSIKVASPSLVAAKEKTRPSILNQATQRLILRWIHIIFGIPIIGYIYSPFDQVHYYARITRTVFVPVILLSGLWMWKGHLVRRLFSSRSAH